MMITKVSFFVDGAILQILLTLVQKFAMMYGRSAPSMARSRT